MNRKTAVVVCEVGKAPYAATLSYEEMVALLDDILEHIRPSTQRAWGQDCPLSDGVVLIAGETARVRDEPPPPNRFGLLGTFLVAGPNGHSLRQDRVAEVIATIQRYDADQESQTIRIPSGLKTAAQWEGVGKKWSPDAHLTGDSRNVTEIGFVNSLLGKYAARLVAYHLYRPFPAMYSLELQFADDAEGRGQARSFVHEYERGFDRSGKLKKAAAAAVQAMYGRRDQGRP